MSAAAIAAASSGVIFPCSAMLFAIVARRSSSSRRYVQTLLERAQLRVVEAAGGFLAIAGDEGHGGLVVEQRDRRVHLGHTNVQLVGDPLGDGGHDVDSAIIVGDVAAPAPHIGELRASLISRRTASRSSIMHADSMPLTPGSAFGRYQVLSALGAGGMGEVFLAHDTRLHRRVALKLLPASGDPDRVGRFVQEARAASALTHPNVAVVYDAGECDGHHFIAMEHVEGRTLAEHLLGGALSTRDVIAIGSQIAEALQAAHASGSSTAISSPPT